MSINCQVPDLSTQLQRITTHLNMHVTLHIVHIVIHHMFIKINIDMLVPCSSFALTAKCPTRQV